MPRQSPERVQTRNPNTGRADLRIDAEKYRAVRRAILKSLPKTGPGLPFKDLPRLVGKALPGGKIPGGGAIPWYTVTVKLDLEARGEIRRVEGATPQRLLRIAALR